jgi:hypothetical protein
VVLVVVACLSAAVANVAVWAWRTALDTDTYTATSAAILGDDDVLTAVTEYLVDEILELVDVEELTASVLPDELDFLSGTGEAAARRTLREVVGSDVLVVDLDSAMQEVADQVDDWGITIWPGGVPEGTAELAVVEAGELGEAKRAVNTLDWMRWLLPALALVTGGAAVAVSPRRPRTLVMLGVGLAGAAVLVLVVEAVAEWSVLEGFTDPIDRLAGQSLWDIASQGLIGQTVLLVVVGVGLAVVGLVLGRFRSPSSRPAAAS